MLPDITLADARRKNSFTAVLMIVLSLEPQKFDMKTEIKIVGCVLGILLLYVIMFVVSLF